MRSRGVVVAAAIALVAATAGCAAAGSGPVDSGAKEAIVPVKVGGVPVDVLAHIVVGQERGFFKEAGLDVELGYAGGSAALVPALLNGQYDVIWGGLLTGLQAVDKGIQLRAIATTSCSTGVAGHDLSAILARADSPVNSGADLGGKKLAVNAINGPHQVQNDVLLSKRGVDVATVQYVEIPIPNMLQSLEMKQVDAVTIPEPFLTSALQQGGFKIVESTPNAWNPDICTSAFYVMQKTLDDKPALVEKFLNGLRKAYAHNAEHPEAFRAAAGSITKIEPAVLKEMAISKDKWEGQAAGIRHYGKDVMSVGAIKNAESIEKLIAPVMP
nr:ABC transporter substrate-binding protein [Microbacterium sp. SYP-A9085]